MKERGMIFNGEMVRAILDGRKTQTRRIIKNCTVGRDEISPFIRVGKFTGCYPEDVPEMIRECCPFGVPGDRIWVRETWATLGNEDGCCVDWSDNLCKGDEKSAARIYRASCEQKPGDYGLWSIPDDADLKPHTENEKFEGAWRPSIHMPRWACRILLEITAVRVERLNDISECDAKAEGAPTECCVIGDKHFLGFRSLWKSIYGDDSWQANPWVWVIEFKRIEGGAA